MAYLTPAELLKRCNLRRLTQLAIPADAVALPSDDTFRKALLGQSLTANALDADALKAVQAGVERVQTAIADANSKMQSYGIPADAATSALARIAATITWYNLEEAAGPLEEGADSAYRLVIKELTGHSSGKLSLVPPPANSSVSTEQVQFVSAPSRYAAYPVDEGAA